VVWIFMENHSRSDVIGSSSAPYETRLAQQCGEATNYQDNGSPSLPNYIAATSGSTQGITDDNPPSDHPLTVDNIFRQVRAAGGTAKSYAESMPASCTLVNSGDYLVRHVPATYYVGADDRSACASDVVPFTAFDPNNLPTFSFITPNRCDDAHDCPAATGDAWLAAHVPAILASADYRSGNTLLVITYDEGGGAIPFIAASAAMTPNSSSGASFSHYALLRLGEDALGLPLLANAKTAGDLRAALGL
jgi:phosphatidylinositol-3-phosphatase